MEIGKANNIKSNSFNINLSEEYHLSVQIGLKKISYCIININTQNIECFKQFDNNNDIINADNILKLNFAHSSIVYFNFPFTLVPEDLFIKENAKEMLELTSDVYDIIQHDKLTTLDTYIIYTIPKEIQDLAYTFFPNAEQKCIQSLLIEKFNTLENNDDHAYLYLNENILNITVYKSNQLIFNNSFEFDNTTDVLYYTLFTLEQLKISPETVDLKLYGEIVKNDATYQILYEYIRNINFGSKPQNLNISSEFNTIKDHQFYGFFK